MVKNKKYEVMNEYLKSENVKSLRKRAKKLNLKRFSKLKKKDLIRLIINEYASRVIQRYVRKNYLSIELENCPISQESWVYPMFPKKSKHKFIYYNIKPLVEYIITVGKEDAVDPLTREKYTDKELELINKLSTASGFTNFLKKINRKRYYQKKKEQEEEIDILINEIRSQANIIRTLIHQLTYAVSQNYLLFSLERAKMSLKQEFEELNRFIRYLYHKSKKWAKKIFDMIRKIIHPQEEEQNFFIMEILDLLEVEENKYAF